MVDKFVKQALSDLAENPHGYAVLDLAERYFTNTDAKNNDS